MKPVDPKLIREMEQLNRALFAKLDEIARGAFSRREQGMALFIFSFGDKSEMTYVSNANREDMVKMLLEFITKNPPAMKWDEQHG